MRLTLGTFTLLIATLMLLAGCGPVTQVIPPTTVPAPPTAVPVPPTAVPVPPTAVPVPPTAVSMDVATRLDTTFTKAAERQFRGAVLIMRGDEVLLRKGYGYADIASQTENTPTTVFRVGGLTKPLTAAAIMLLESQGKLSVADPICAYIDTCPAAWAPVTLHHLLSNTSGIPTYVLKDYTLAVTPDALLTLVRDKPLSFAPGADWELSQTNYILLGMVIERVSGQSYGTFLQEQIFNPLGMSATGYAAQPDGIATGYRGNAVADPFDPSVAYAAYGLYSTIDDLYRWNRAFLADDLLPQAQREKMTQHYWTYEPFSYGYGVVVSDRHFVGHQLVGFGMGVSSEQPYGVYRGYDSTNFSITDLGLFVVILTNQEYANAEALNDVVANILLSDQ